MPDKIKKIRGDDPRFNENTPKRRKGYRSIHFPSGVWQWKAKHDYKIIIYSPTRERHEMFYWEMLDITREAFLERRWANYCCEICCGGYVQPSEIRNFISWLLHKG